MLPLPSNMSSRPGPGCSGGDATYSGAGCPRDRARGRARRIFRPAAPKPSRLS